MFGLTLGKSKQQVRILYRSGLVHTFWVYDLRVKHDGGVVKQIDYSPADYANQPIFFGIDHIDAIYQIGSRKSVWKLFH